MLHENVGDSAASAVELGFEHTAGRRAVGDSAKVSEIGDEADHFEQGVEVGLLLGRDVHEDGAAAPLFGIESAIG